MDVRVDQYIDNHSNYSKILRDIRAILNLTELKETIKWGIPTYTINNKNVLGIAAFKSYCGIWFFQGGLLKDTDKVLINAQEGKTMAMRQWRFTNDSKLNKELLLLYIQEAIDNEKKGLKIKHEKKPLLIPDELENLLVQNKLLSASFNNLTLTEKREFAEYIAQAKKEITKTKRLEKIIPMILNNIGLNDNYKNC